MVWSMAPRNIAKRMPISVSARSWSERVACTASIVPSPGSEPRPLMPIPQSTVAQHSISTFAPKARPSAPRALRAGLGPGKYSV